MLALRQSHPEGPIEQVAAPEGEGREDQETGERGRPDDRVNRSGDEFEILGADLAARLEEEQALSPEFVVDSRIVVVAAVRRLVGRSSPLIWPLGSSGRPVSSSRRMLSRTIGFCPEAVMKPDR